MTNITEEYQKVLEFICRLEDVDDISHLFEYLDNFWQTQFKTTPMLVYSRNLAKSKILRDYANKGKDSIFYDSDELEKFKGLIETLDEARIIGNIKEKENFLYAYKCGNFKGQDFFVAFKITNPITEHVANYFVQFLQTTFTKISRYKEADNLKSLVHIDDVTGLYNQRKFIIDIENSILDFEKFKKVFSIIFIDIDHFKQVNDGHGHLVGTTLLKNVAKVINETVRDGDLCYRYGGDEFVLIIPMATYIEAKAIGNRVLSNIKKEIFVIEDGINGTCEFKLTVSVGIACFPQDANSKVDIINLADKMMYKAKQSGRGMVCHASDLFSKDEEKENK